MMNFLSKLELGPVGLDGFAEDGTIQAASPLRCNGSQISTQGINHRHYKATHLMYSGLSEVGV